MPPQERDGLLDAINQSFCFGFHDRYSFGLFVKGIDKFLPDTTSKSNAYEAQAPNILKLHVKYISGSLFAGIEVDKAVHQE